MRYLLDTNIVSELVRNPAGRTARRIVEVGESQICTSVIVAAELWYGAVKRGSQRLTIQLEAILSALEIVPIESPAARVYGQLRIGSNAPDCRSEETISLLPLRASPSE